MSALLDRTEGTTDESDDGEEDPPGPEATNDCTESGAGPRPDGGLATADVDATFELPTDAGTARMSVPESATPDEAAAVAAALAAHFAEEDEDGDPAESADPWILSQRLGCRRRSELPRSCPPDGAWAAAGRSGR